MKLERLSLRPGGRVELSYLVWPRGGQLEHVSRYWQLTRRDGNELEAGTERVYRKEESWVCAKFERSPRE